MTRLPLLTPTLLLASALPLASPVVSAKTPDLQFSSTTMFRAYVRPGLPDPQTRLPLYELLELNGRNTGIPGLSVHASLWGRVDPTVRSAGGEGTTGDVDIFVATYRAPAKTALEGLDLRLGRQLIAAGPSVLDQIDGGQLSYRLLGVELQAFGGLVAGTRFVDQAWPRAAGNDQTGQHWTLGGRLAYTGSGLLSAGASYRQKRYYGLVAFHEVGADLRIHPKDWIEIIGDAVITLPEARAKEVHASTRLRLRRDLRLGAGYRFVSPDLFIPRSSIFSVFSEETHHAAYVDSYWAISRRTTLRAEFGLRAYGEACITLMTGAEACNTIPLQVEARLRADQLFGFAGQYRLAAELERVGAPDGGFVRARLAGSLPLIERLALAADLDLYFRDDRGDWIEAARDSNVAVSATASARYALRPNLILVVSGQAQVTPLMSSAGALMSRLDWLIDRPSR